MTQVFPTTRRSTHSIIDWPSQSVKEGDNSLKEHMKEQEVELTGQQSSRLEVLVAEMKGQVLNELQNQRGKLDQLDQKLSGFQTKSEALRDQREVDRRLISLEDDRRWIVRQIIMIWFGGIMTVLGTSIAFIRKAF